MGCDKVISVLVKARQGRQGNLLCSMTTRPDYIITTLLHLLPSHTPPPPTTSSTNNVCPPFTQPIQHNSNFVCLTWTYAKGRYIHVNVLMFMFIAYVFQKTELLEDSGIRGLLVESLP